MRIYIICCFPKEERDGNYRKILSCHVFLSDAEKELERLLNYDKTERLFYEIQYHELDQSTSDLYEILKVCLL